MLAEPQFYGEKEKGFCILLSVSSLLYVNEDAGITGLLVEYMHV